MVVDERSVGDVVSMASPRAHGPSSWAGVDPHQDPVLWEDLGNRTAGTADALDAPATEGADAEADVAAVAAAVVAGDSLGQEGKALVHDGDDRRRDAVALAQYEQASAALMSVRQIEGDNVDTGSSQDDGARREEEEAAAVVEAGSDVRDEGEDAVVILLVEVCRPATKRGVGVWYREVQDPCLCMLYMYGTTCTHNQERGEEKSRDHEEAVAMDRYCRFWRRRNKGSPGGVRLPVPWELEGRVIIGTLQQWQSIDRDGMGVGVSGTTGYDDMYEVLRTVSKMGGLRETGGCRVKSSQPAPGPGGISSWAETRWRFDKLSVPGDRRRWGTDATAARGTRVRGEGGGDRRRRGERDALERLLGEGERKAQVWRDRVDGVLGRYDVDRTVERRAQFWDRWDQPQGSRHKRRSAGVGGPGERLLRAN